MDRSPAEQPRALPHHQTAKDHVDGAHQRNQVPADRQEQVFQGRKVALRGLALDLKRELDQLDLRLEETRLALVKASQDKKVLEKLEEKQLEEHSYQLNREEQAFLDELAAHASAASAA